jgi:Uncharacterized protein conserved in bacteria (DUF2188)
VAKKRDIHVVPHDDRWATKTEGASRAGRVFETKKDAMDAARDQAKREHVERIEHRADGTIVNPNSYGKDPNPPKDRVR